MYKVPLALASFSDAGFISIPTKSVRDSQGMSSIPNQVFCIFTHVTFSHLILIWSCLLCWVDIVDLTGEPWRCFQIRGCKPCILAAPGIGPSPALSVLSLDERLTFCFAADLWLLTPQSRKTCLHHQRFLLPQVLVQHPSLAACMKSRVPLSLVFLFTSCPGNDHVSG